MTRLDFGPLARLVCTERGEPDCGDDYLSQRFGVQRRTVQRWHHRGVSVWWADRLATRVGLEPSLVWGAEYEEAIDAECQAKEGCWTCGHWPCVCGEDVEQLTLAVPA